MLNINDFVVLTLSNIKKIPKNKKQLDKHLIFLETYIYFNKYINFEEWYANFMFYNKIDMISLLNIHIREYDIILNKDKIIREIMKIEIKEEYKFLSKFNKDICINYDFLKFFNTIKSSYSKIFNI
jgi:hypothetical protein